MQAENSMIKDVMIRVTSLQRNDSGQDEKISLETPGKFGIQKGFSYITYQETELTGMEGTTTSLRFYPDSVNLVRVGKILQQQEYKPGAVTYSQYETPFGTLQMGVHTRGLENTISGGSGHMRIAYDIDLDGVFCHYNELTVDVWEDPEKHGNKGAAETTD